jgi:hypothetical protein
MPVADRRHAAPASLWTKIDNHMLTADGAEKQIQNGRTWTDKKVAAVAWVGGWVGGVGVGWAKVKRERERVARAVSQ